VARLRAGDPVDLQRETTDLVAVAEQVVHECQLATDQLAIRVETEESSITGYWDQRRLGRVLANLLMNAIKFSPNGGEIMVRIAREPAADTSGPGTAEKVSIAVHDQGVGIPAADLPRMFERFHRATNVIGRIGGSGIGLFGARRIIEQHGGTISVESEEGVGSTFTVRLPRHE
jgi:signal transduction histidine kinase